MHPLKSDRQSLIWGIQAAYKGCLAAPLKSAAIFSVLSEATSIENITNCFLPFAHGGIYELILLGHAIVPPVPDRTSGASLGPVWVASLVRTDQKLVPKLRADGPGSLGPFFGPFALGLRPEALSRNLQQSISGARFARVWESY